MPDWLRNNLRRAAWLALLAWFVPCVTAQINPIRLKVTRNDKKDRQTVSQNTDGTVRRQQIHREVYFTVEIANATTEPVSGIRVGWAILVNPQHATATGGSTTVGGGTVLKVVEGERTCALSVGQRFVFDTDIIELSAVRNESARTGASSQVGGDVVGYAVEVFVGDRLIAQEIVPADTKRKIEQLKAAENKTIQQQRHKF